MIAKTETMPIQENHSSEKKKLTIKVDTVSHLTHSNCRKDRGMNNAKIAQNVNDRELFAELLEPPISPLLIHMVPPFMEVKDPMFCLQINGEVIWESRQVWAEWREKLKRMAQ